LLAPIDSKIPENFQLNSMEIAPGKALKVNVSVPNTRLFVGNIPKSKSREDIANEFDKLSGKKLSDSRGNPQVLSKLTS